MLELYVKAYILWSRSRMQMNILAVEDNMREQSNKKTAVSGEKKSNGKFNNSKPNVLFDCLFSEKIK